MSASMQSPKSWIEELAARQCRQCGPDQTGSDDVDVMMSTRGPRSWRDSAAADWLRSTPKPHRRRQTPLHAARQKLRIPVLRRLSFYVADRSVYKMKRSYSFYLCSLFLRRSRPEEIWVSHTHGHIQTHVPVENFRQTRSAVSEEMRLEQTDWQTANLISSIARGR